MPSGVNNSSIEAMSKKSIMLLRNAMRPNIFGNIVTLKTQWFFFICNCIFFLNKTL